MPRRVLCMTYTCNHQQHMPCLRAATTCMQSCNRLQLGSTNATDGAPPSSKYQLALLPRTIVCCCLAMAYAHGPGRTAHSCRLVCCL
mmetsp:Transcript_18039/g.38792  ORF Transcript_18039/g.38792 Transcript_18039/m.38792 type:complete len:87 (-) Transcript_18039:1658-1918(-)